MGCAGMAPWELGVGPCCSEVLLLSTPVPSGASDVSILLPSRILRMFPALPASEEALPDWLDLVLKVVAHWPEA